MALLGFLRRLIGRAAAEAPSPRAIAKPAKRTRPKVAAGTVADATPTGDDDKKPSFMRREAILNRQEQVAGYEFSLTNRVMARMARRGGVAARAYDVALLTRLELHRAASLLGSRLALVTISIDSIDNQAIDRLPRENTVLIFELADGVQDWLTPMAGLARLKQAGFRVGIRIADPAEADCPLIAAADLVQVDIPAFNGIDLRTLARKLKAARPEGQATLRLLAREVESDDDYQLCYKCGFDLFQGAFVTSPDGQMKPTRTAINRVSALAILNMLRTDQSFSAIADELKNEPTLSYKLLRYLNSAAVGLQKPTDNLTEALVLLGRDKFYRWTSLLLFDFDKPGYREQLLSERALTRARTLELLAGKGVVPRLPDQLFLIGLFSLLDQALGQPLSELVEKAALPEVVRDTLLGLPGPCTGALRLVALAEADADTPAERLAAAQAACGISDGEFAPLAAEALVWAGQMLGGEAAGAARPASSAYRQG